MQRVRRPIGVRPGVAAAALALLFLLPAMPVAQAGAPPAVTGFKPACGPVGTSVKIQGDHFQGTTLVEFNGADQTTFTVDSPSLITAAVPVGATTGKIRVTTPEGSADSVDDFTVSSSCAPTINGFSPTSGPVGAAVTINGTDFVNTTAVKFNGTKATTFSWNPSGTQLTTTVPSGTTTGEITVVTPLGTAKSAGDFVVTGAGAPPTITSFVPITGPVGTSVVITGTNFTGATDVKFKSTSATSFKVDSATQITAVVPSGAQTGKIGVTTPAGTATSATAFTVTAQGSPTITSFSPTSGPVGTSVVIIGTNFNGVQSVKFNGTASKSFTVNSSTRITAVVPPTATTGPITVTNSHGTGKSATDFTVTLPAITSFSPTSGPVGTLVTITGSGFLGATQVRFNVTSTTSFNVNSQGTKITVRVPSGATTGPISVVTPSGTATSSTSFTVLPAFHNRSITLRLRRHLIAGGFVTVGDGFAACYQHVPVAIQRKVFGRWRTIAFASTGDGGFYRRRIADRAGAYRAVARKAVLASNVCRRAVSGVKLNA